MSQKYLHSICVIILVFLLFSALMIVPPVNSREHMHKVMVIEKNQETVDKISEILSDLHLLSNKHLPALIARTSLLYQTKWFQNFIQNTRAGLEHQFGADIFERINPAEIKQEINENGWREYLESLLTSPTENQVIQPLSANNNIDGPTANFTWSPRNPTDLNIIFFNDTSKDANGWIDDWWWDFGDGSNSNEKNPYHRYYDNGNYTVTLRVWDNDGYTDFISKNVTVRNVAPVADFSYRAASLRELKTIEFTDESIDQDGRVNSFRWSFGDGTTSSQRDPVHTYSRGGFYSVRLEIADDDEAKSQVSKNVFVLSTFLLAILAPFFTFISILLPLIASVMSGFFTVALPIMIVIALILLLLIVDAVILSAIITAPIVIMTLIIELIRSIFGDDTVSSITSVQYLNQFD